MRDILRPVLKGVLWGVLMASTSGVGNIVPPTVRTSLGIFAVPGYANLTRDYSMQPAVKGGSGTRTYSLSGSLPMGLSFDTSTGEISGVPTVQGTFSGLTITVEDDSGTSTSPAFAIVVGAAPVSVAPSGDTTGATDVAAVNAQLAAGKSVVLSGAYYANAAIVQPGETAIYADSGSWKLADASNCNIWLNLNQASQTRMDQNLAVIGGGPSAFFFDGNGSAQTRQTNARSNQAFVGISVQNAVLRGFKVCAEASAMHLLGALYARVSEIDFAQQDLPNTDGLDLAGGTSYVQIANITGDVYDDCFSFYAKVKQSDTMMAAGTPWETGGDISNIYIKSVSVACNLDQLFRLQAGNGFKLTGIYAETVANTAPTDTHAKVLIQTGEITYLDSTSHHPSPYDIADIVIEGVTGFDKWLRADTSCSDIHVYDIVQDRPISNAISSDETGTPIIYRASFDGVTEGGSGGHDTFINNSMGTFIELSIANVQLMDLTRFVGSSEAIQGLAVSDFAIEGGPTPLFSSTPISFGTFANFTLAGQPLDPSAAFTPVVKSFTDDFNRADGNFNGSPGWDYINGSTTGALISGNMLAANDTDTNGTAFAAPSTGSLDHFVQAVPTAPVRADSFVAARLVDYKNYVGFRYSVQNAQWELYQKVNATFTQLGTSPDAAGTGKTARLEVEGNTATLKVDGNAIISATVDDSLLSTRAGFVCRGTLNDPWIDDFACGAL